MSTTNESCLLRNARVVYLGVRAYLLNRSAFKMFSQRAITHCVDNYLIAQLYEYLGCLEAVRDISQVLKDDAHAPDASMLDLLDVFIFAPGQRAIVFMW